MLPSVVILCGGRGTRLQEHVPSLPKPLVEIGGRPILWHVMQIYLAQGFSDFVLLTGHQAEMIETFVRDTPWPAGMAVRCVNTGSETPTGGRIALAAAEIEGERFCATYADGVADINLAELLDEHAAGGTTATMTVVRPELQFGVAEMNGDGRVRGFVEKPRSDWWVNGGFFCFERQIFDVLEPDSVLEREPLEQLAAAGELRAFRHTGFWECMDTYKDALQLDDLWSTGHAPWKLWR
ncbi:MAG TPA: sugar phosphate nucleotidyltransferase [Solirubrobacteraceae bacterium]|nr:sugar phosphate nucleotidyltransferase [Solirubrobacteraceae bacterium]